MKKTLAAAAMIVVALWFGCAVGYHQGQQQERKAWFSTREMDNNCHRMYFTLPQSPKSDSLRIRSANIPDPRDLPFK